MTPPLFLVDPARLTGDRVLLDGAEGRHAATVRRLEVRERVVLADGAGALWEGVVATVDRDRLEVDVVVRREEPAPQPRLVVVQALPKGDRGELAVETMAEVGVDVVVPWAAERCVTQWRGERGERSLRKWRATAREAAKQARRARVPEVADLATTRRVAELLAAAALPAVLHEDAEAPLAAVEPPPEGDVVLVVGPEGGVSEEELRAFGDAGATAYRLGPTVLRTSTAGVAALALLLARTPRWR